MRTILTIVAVTGIALSISACRKNEADQNIVITNEVPANADIEALPPDESSGTPSDQLANGEDNADVADLNASQNDF